MFTHLPFPQAQNPDFCQGKTSTKALQANLMSFH
jgi:hypothetical protein